MEKIRYLQKQDQEFWRQLDKHLPETEFQKKVRDKQAYVFLKDDRPVGIFRYNLFWDQIPFGTMLFIAREFQGRGYGTKLMEYWEKQMRMQGYGMVLVSTQADESAQHFYRTLGYHDCGGLMLTCPGYEQPMELFLAKPIRELAADDLSRKTAGV